MPIPSLSRTLLVICSFAAACTNPPGGSSSSSSSSSSGGSSSSSSSTGGTSSSTSSGGTSSSTSSGGTSSGIAPGEPIPLESLCPSLARGYLRLSAATVLALSRGFGGDNSCGIALSDDDLLPYLFPDVGEAERSLCAADGGVTLEMAATLSRMVSEGRVRYDAEAAGNIVGEGRRLMALYGGLAGAIEGRDAGPVDSGELNEATASVIVGLRGEGQPCRVHLECGTADDNLSCVFESAVGCMGVCRASVGSGQECGAGLPLCGPNLVCITPGGATRGRCVDATPRASGQPCQVDGGQFSCGDGLACREDTCQPLAGPDGGCSSDEHCGAGLYCSGSHCGSPKGVGEACAPFGDRCDECLACVDRSTGDGGSNYRCTMVATAGQACIANPCVLGTACISAQCRPLARTGEACAFPDGTEPDLAMRGNCLFAAEACIGSPASCTARGGANDACKAPAAASTATGSCSVNHFCRRTSGTATDGTCTALPTLGQPCGTMRYDRGPCSGDLRCAGESETQPGQCVSQRSPVGTRCVTGGDCEEGLWCRNADGGSTCQQLPSLGQNCDSFSGCADAVCRYTGTDAGFGYWCMAPTPLNSACTYSSECGPNATCLDAVCASRSALGGECRTDTDCASGTFCVEGACRDEECRDTIAKESCVGNTPLLLMYGVVLGGAGWWRRKKSRRS